MLLISEATWRLLSNATRWRSQSRNKCERVVQLPHDVFLSICAHLCTMHFGKLKQELIRHHVIISLSEKLQLDPKLMLETAVKVKVARNSEIIKNSRVNYVRQQKMQRWTNYGTRRDEMTMDMYRRS